MITRYTKIRKVASPERGHNTDAGIDFFVPDYTEEFMEDLRKLSKTGIKSIFRADKNIGFVIHPHSNILIPSGIKMEIAAGYMGMFADKSGIASKKELLVGAKIIDTNYSGEIHLDIHNVSNKDQEVLFGQKMVQLIFVPIGSFQLLEISGEDLYNWNHDHEVRGEGGFGSTGS